MAEAKHSSTLLRAVLGALLFGVIATACTQPSATPSPVEESRSSVGIGSTTVSSTSSGASGAGPTDPGSSNSGATDSTASTPAGPSTSRFDTTSPDTTPSTSAPSPPEIPAAATKKTEAGAEAFVRYYVSNLNYAVVANDSDNLQGFAGKGCEVCSAYVRIIARRAELGGRQEGGVLQIDEISRVRGQPLGNAALFASAVQSPAVVWPRQGVSPSRTGRLMIHLEIELRWTGDGWQVEEFETPR